VAYSHVLSYADLVERSKTAGHTEVSPWEREAHKALSYAFKKEIADTMIALAE
jgi:hypothetical protein